MKTIYKLELLVFVITVLRISQTFGFELQHAYLLTQENNTDCGNGCIGKVGCEGKSAPEPGL